MYQVKTNFEGVLELIIRSIEIGKSDNAKAIAQDALRQLQEQNKKDETDESNDE